MVSSFLCQKQSETPQCPCAKDLILHLPPGVLHGLALPASSPGKAELPPCFLGLVPGSFSASGPLLMLLLLLGTHFLPPSDQTPDHILHRVSPASPSLCRVPWVTWHLLYDCLASASPTRQHKSAFCSALCPRHLAQGLVQGRHSK